MDTKNPKLSIAQVSTFSIDVNLPYQLKAAITIHNAYTTSDLLQDLCSKGLIDCSQYAIFFNNIRLGVEDILIEKGVKENCKPLYVISDDLFSNTQPTSGDLSEDEIDANTEYIRNGDFDKVKPFDVGINIFDQIAVMKINKTTTTKNVLDWLVRNNRKFLVLFLYVRYY